MVHVSSVIDGLSVVLLLLQPPALEMIERRYHPTGRTKSFLVYGAAAPIGLAMGRLVNSSWGLVFVVTYCAVLLVLAVLSRHRRTAARRPEANNEPDARV
jgi:uncharacterized membrane protein YhaH (DUF805 family)